MKKKWLGIRVAAGLCAALGWWGLLYPELALTPDTVKVSAQDTIMVIMTARSPPGIRSGASMAPCIWSC